MTGVEKNSSLNDPVSSILHIMEEQISTIKTVSKELPSKTEHFQTLRMIASEICDQCKEDEATKIDENVKSFDARLEKLNDLLMTRTDFIEHHYDSCKIFFSGCDSLEAYWIEIENKMRSDEELGEDTETLKRQKHSHKEKQDELNHTQQKLDMLVGIGHSLQEISQSGISTSVC